MSSLPGLGGRDHHGPQGLVPRAPTGDQRGKGHGGNRKGRRSKCLHVTQRIVGSQVLTASRDGVPGA